MAFLVGSSYVSAKWKYGAQHQPQLVVRFEVTLSPSTSIKSLVISTLLDIRLTNSANLQRKTTTLLLLPLLSFTLLSPPNIRGTRGFTSEAGVCGGVSTLSTKCLTRELYEASYLILVLAANVIPCGAEWEQDKANNPYQLVGDIWTPQLRYPTMVCTKCQKVQKATELATPSVKRKHDMYYGSPASSSSNNGGKPSATLGNTGIGKVRNSTWDTRSSV